jgi:hypothetical protein
MPSPEITAVVTALKASDTRALKQASEAFMATLNPERGHGFFSTLNGLTIAVRDRANGDDPTVAKTFAAAITAAYDARFPNPPAPGHRAEFLGAVGHSAASWKVAATRDNPAPSSRRPGGPR